MMICLTEPSSIYSDHIIMWWGLIEKLHEHGLCLVTIKFMETQKSILASEIFLSNLIIINLWTGLNRCFHAYVSLFVVTLLWSLF